MTLELFMDCVLTCIIYNGDIKDYCDKSVLYKFSPLVFENLDKFEEIAKIKNIKIKKANINDFNIIIKGIAAYYQIEEKFVIISTGIGCFLIDH